MLVNHKEKKVVKSPPYSEKKLFDFSGGGGNRLFPSQAYAQEHNAHSFFLNRGDNAPELPIICAYYYFYMKMAIFCATLY